jgi:hypothetical protein
LITGNPATSYVGAFLAPLGSNATEATYQVTVQNTSTLSNFKVFTGAAGTVGKTWQFTVMKNNAPISPNSVTCTIAAATTCSDTTHTASFTAGDTIDIKVVATGTPTATTMGWVANLN